MSAWSWTAHVCLGEAGAHRSVPIRVQSPTAWRDLPSIVDQAAFTLGFVPSSGTEQSARIVANALSATTRIRIEVQLDGVDAVADPAGASFPTETHSWGHVEILHETAAVGLYHLHLAPGGVIPRHIHERLAEIEMIASPNIHCHLGALPAGSIVAWPRQASHSYHNTDVRAVASILCVNQPRFDHIDEVVVDDSFQNTGKLEDARLMLCHDPWHEMLALRAEFQFPGAFSGQHVTYYVRNEVHPDADAALVAIVDGTNIVICRHHRRGWELPGGKRDPGESIEETARREALEETGITLGPDLNSFGYFIGTGNGPRHVKQIFMATIANCADHWNKNEMLEIGRANPSAFACRALQDPSVSFLCQDAVISIVAALLRCRM